MVWFYPDGKHITGGAFDQTMTFYHHFVNFHHHMDENTTYFEYICRL